MPNIIIREVPECPLCLKRMRQIYTKQGKFFACLENECMISIRADALELGKWDRMKDKPQCPKCGTAMRVFFRIADGYVKAQCPKCRGEGKVVMVERGKVQGPTPDSWSINPEELLDEK